VIACPHTFPGERFIEVYVRYISKDVEEHGYNGLYRVVDMSIGEIDDKFSKSNVAVHAAC